MRKWNVLALMFCYLLTSCQHYKTSFDCPPGEGVPCTSVSNIEKMIIETDKGPDIFVRQKMCPSSGKRIWINDYKNQDGVLIEGYYIYLKD